MNFSKQTTKNKLILLLWLLIVVIYTYNLIAKTETSWLYIVTNAMLILIAISNINNLRVISLVNDYLIVKRFFSKEKQYDLNSIKHWNEIDYSLLGIKTYRKIIIQLNEDEKIYVFQNDSIYFEKISDYLNDNWPRKFENIK